MGKGEKYFLSLTNHVNERNLSIYYQAKAGENASLDLILSASRLKPRIADNIVAGPISGTGSAINFTVLNINPEGTYEYVVNVTENGTSCSSSLADRASVRVSDCDYDENFSFAPCVFPACHFISNDIYLGPQVSADNSSTGESTNDDGITYPNDIRPGNTIRLPVNIYNNTGNTAYLSGWIDWNGDGDFEDMGEQITEETYPSVSPNIGAYVVYIPVIIPVTAERDIDLRSRWRLSTDSSIAVSPCGAVVCATDGEVEDYLMRIGCQPTACLPVQLSVRSSN